MKRGKNVTRDLEVIYIKLLSHFFMFIHFNTLAPTSTVAAVVASVAAASPCCPGFNYRAILGYLMALGGRHWHWHSLTWPGLTRCMTMNAFYMQCVVVVALGLLARHSRCDAHLPRLH